MLSYVSKYGDQNLAIYNFKKNNPKEIQISEELKQREAHKYDLYRRLDQIVFKEEVFEIEGLESGDAGNGGNIDIDWS